MSSLAEKIAVVTGGARGIGRGIVDALVSSGAIVVIADVEPEAMRLIDSSTTPPHRIVSLQLDVSRADQVQQCFHKIVELFGRIDILVNNAGIAQPKDVLQITEADWDKVLDVNLKGTFLCCQAVLPEMIKQGSGRIINVSSISARRGALYGHVHYSASKAGQLGLTKSIARWCAGKGITVNAIAPGSVETAAFAATATTSQRQEVINNTPVKRLGTPREIGAMVAWLCSEEASFVTGAVLDINGGAWMG